MSPYSQLLGDVVWRGPTDQRVVALTFDDGPNEPYTSHLADMLAQRAVHATFFQVGKAVLAAPEVSRRLVSDGHVVASHGYSHYLPRYLDERSLQEHIRRAQDAIASIGVVPELYRPPWLFRTPALWRVLEREGLRAVSGQFCHPLEVLQPSPSRISTHAVARVRPGSIVIVHDGFDGHGGRRAHSVEAAKIVVDRLMADGYRFVTVSELLDLPAYQSSSPGSGANEVPA
jgi:peptidoglycan/xylan/chitin deacetylase (PgdA/CDA1 family)